MQRILRDIKKRIAIVCITGRPGLRVAAMYVPLMYKMYNRLHSRDEDQTTEFREFTRFGERIKGKVVCPL